MSDPHAPLIERCSIADLRRSPSIDALLSEYEAESKIAGLPAADPQWPLYEAMESAGALQALRATVRSELVGFIVLVVHRVPHYSQLIAATESYFVAAAHRHTGAGIALLREAEKMAKERGAVCLFVSAPAEGRLARMLPGAGFIETNTVFFRSFA